MSLQFGPIFDFRKAFYLGLVANYVLPHPIVSFLNICKQTRAPKSVWRWVEVQYKENLPYWEQEMQIDREVNESVAEIERRITSGKPMGKIEAELREKLKEAREKQNH